MPSYYFHIRENGELIKDQDGIELPNIDAVHDEVRNSIIAVLKDERPGELSADREFQVEDQDGRTVLTVPFGLAVPWNRPQAEDDGEAPLGASECVREVCADQLN